VGVDRSTPNGHAGSGDEQPIRVLIVDDHRLFADSLRLLLDRAASVDVVGIAGDGPEAIDLALAQDAQVVLMDIGLPSFDGFEAARKLLTIKKAARVIALSGRSESEVSAEAAASGMVAYLSKDRIHETVLDAIHAAMLSPEHAA
jgi:DNA-binding NarL/FixJ family response regulator